MKKSHIIWLCLGIILIIIAPALFTLPSFVGWLDFSDNGQIGDTIGGITAPVVGLISILLLFYTLKSQLDFNKSQVADNSLSHIISLQSDITSFSNAFEIRFSNTGHNEPICLHGLFHIHVLEEPESIFYNDNLRTITSQVINIEILCIELLKINKKSSLPKSIQEDIYRFAENYLDAVRYFYRGTISGRIKAKFKIDEVWDESGLAEELFGKDPNKALYENHQTIVLQTLKECAI